MESEPLNPAFRINPENENFHPCIKQVIKCPAQRHIPAHPVSLKPVTLRSQAKCI